MLLRDKATGGLVEILVDREILDPNISQVTGRYSSGELDAELRLFYKVELQFCSGEPLPRCWTDPRHGGRSGGAGCLP